MLTSFFSNSKPINYFLLASVFVMGYVLKIFLTTIEGSNSYAPWVYFLLSLLGVFILLLFDFIIRKNAITKQNTYALFLFTFGLLLTIDGTTTASTFLCILFILLAIRRIISLKSNKNNEKKILDATLYICIASYFEFWALLLFALLYIAIIQKNETSWRYYFIPFVGFIVFVILYTSYFLITKDTMAPFVIWNYSLNINFESFLEKRNLTQGVCLILPLLLAIVYRFTSMNTLQKKDKNTAYLVIMYATLSTLIVLLSFNNTSIFVLLLPPFAIVVGNAIETAKANGSQIFFWSTELFLWTWLILPFIVGLSL